jgi:hypothetical protein
MYCHLDLSQLSYGRGLLGHGFRRVQILLQLCDCVVVLGQVELHDGVPPIVREYSVGVMNERHWVIYGRDYYLRKTS